MEEPTSSSVPDSARTTLVFALLGLVQSVSVYIITTNFVCNQNQNLMDRLKPHLLKLGKKLLKSCKKCCGKGKSDQTALVTAMNGADVGDGGDVTENRADEGTESPDDDDDDVKLCSSYELHHITTGLYLVVARGLLIIMNIVYFAVVGASFTADGIDEGIRRARIVTFLSILWELQNLVLQPLVLFISRFCCCGRARESCCRDYLQFLRFIDIFLAVLVGPFLHTNFFVLGGGWIVAVFVRVYCYAIILASCVISGVRYTIVLVFPCCPEWVFFNYSENLNIKNFKHFVIVIILKLVPIALKFSTASSALATFFTLAYNQSDTVKYTYLGFTVARGVSSILSLPFAATLLRWELMDDTAKYETAENCTTKIMRGCSKYQIHTHIAFYIDLMTYCGLIALNSYLVHNI